MPTSARRSCPVRSLRGPGGTVAIRAQMREENGLPRRCAARNDSAIGVSFDTTAPCGAKKYPRADVGIMQGNRRQSRRRLSKNFEGFKNRREGKCERHLRRGAPERNRRSRHLARRETVRVSFRVQSNRFPYFYQKFGKRTQRGKNTFLTR